MSWRSKAERTTLLLALMSVTVGHTQPLEIALHLPSYQQEQADRYREAAARTAAYLETWLGPLPEDRITLEAVAWTAMAPPVTPGTMRVPQRWLTLKGDRSLERGVVAAFARRYWFHVVRFAPDSEWLAAGLVRFTAVRTMSELIEGEHYLSAPLFDGLIAVPVRFAPLTTDWWEGRPPPLTFAEVDAVLANQHAATTARAMRATRALQTLERFLGRPVLDAAISDFAQQFRGREATAPDLMTTIEHATGRDLSWFAPAFDEGARYDYGVAALETQPSGNLHTSRVVVRRWGNGVFAGTSQTPTGPFDEGRGIEVLARFADGTELREYWDGRAESRTFAFVGQAPLVAATVDPAVILILDEDWTNNRRTLSPLPQEAAWQWSLLWTAWLQHFMLSMTAIV